MIAVLADDFSGAAELAGAATTFGFSAEVHTAVGQPCDAHVCVYDVNSRAVDTGEAIERTIRFAVALKSTRLEWIFKKVDSLLRGHPSAEISALVDLLDYHRALLCPANPSRGRVIRSGRYFVDGTPLDATHFATDPAHPRRTADVRELLGSRDERIFVPNAETAADLLRLAGGLDHETLAAGAVEFFEAVLTARNHQPVANPPPAIVGSRLFVCGSAAAWRQGRPEQAAARDVPIVLLENDAARSVGDVAVQLRERRRVLLAMDPSLDLSGREIECRLAEAVAAVIAHQPPDWLLLEGGATARAVLESLGWTRFHVAGQLAPGTVMLETIAAAPRIVTKPGSYAWPDGVWSE